MFDALSGLNPVPRFVDMFADPLDRWFALYLVCSFLIAFAVFLWEARRDPDVLAQGLWRHLFPKKIYAHKSAIADYYYFALNKLLFVLVFSELVVVSSWAQSGTVQGLGAIAKSPELALPVWLATLSTTLIWILAIDFGLWLGHYLMHKVPILWEFHKVHHSAEVLTPFTAGRMHPLDDIFTGLLGGVLGGIASGVCYYLLAPQPQMFGVLQLNILTSIFYAAGFHLRHSHIWLPYKGWLGRLFVSPAHHQLHHSKAERHWDKNLGFMFAIWDGMFGTLYAVDQREEFEIGMNGREEPEYHSVRALYFLPFVKAWRLVRAKGRAVAPPAEVGKPRQVSKT
ncbi:sterol desaturase family protein [Methylovirgula sp. 4M-Z18]|uniref:sterol desaturase family protein n=1 Tax=Methylovirgula sp. 4M-Z18 TaxID=2293567 RepID=UPI0013145407|nr:sterol desaturase family protein [Methylovirgula sp. 4M-Z18]